MANKITIDLASLGLSWAKGETYTVEVGEGLVTSNTGIPSPASTALSMTTNATGPVLSQTYPTHLSTNVFENETITFTFDRNITRTSGYVSLYKVGSPDTQIATWEVNTLTLSNNQFTVDITGLLEASETYYIQCPVDIVVDIDNFGNELVDVTIFSWTTDAQFSPDVDILLGNDLGIIDWVYNEDTESTISNGMSLLDTSYSSGTYTVDITGAGFQLISSTGGGSAVWNAGTYTITGTREDVNAHLSSLVGRPVDDYDQNFVLYYTITNPNSTVTNRQQNITISVTNEEVIDISLSRNAYIGSATFIFETNTPYIDDDPGYPEDTYSVNISCPNGTFGILDDTPVATLNLTGDKATINAQFADIKFYPDATFTADSSVHYQQYRNGNLQIDTTFTLTRIATLNPADTITETWNFLLDVSNWTPTPEQILYGKFAAVVVGGGGGGSGGGYPSIYHGTGGSGGGGGVSTMDFTTFTFNDFPMAFTVGQPGQPVTGYGTGQTGGTSTAFGLTSTGGLGGTMNVTIYNGGNSFDYYYAGGASGNPTTSPGQTMSGTINWSPSEGYVPSWPTQGPPGGDNSTEVLGADWDGDTGGTLGEAGSFNGYNGNYGEGGAGSSYNGFPTAGGYGLVSIRCIPQL